MGLEEGGEVGRMGKWRGGKEQLPAPRGFGDGDLGMRSGCAGGRLVWVVVSLGRAGVAWLEVHQDQYRVVLILFLFLWFFGQKSSFCKIAALQFLGTERNPQT